MARDQQARVRRRDGERSQSGIHRRPRDTGRVGDSSVILLDQGELQKKRGLGVTAKIAIAMSAAITVLMTVFGVMVYNAVAKVLSQEVDEAGITAVRALALPAYETWLPLHGTMYQNREEDYRNSKLPEINSQPLVQNQINRNRNRINDFLTTDTKLKDALILTLDRKEIVQGRGTTQLTPTGSPVEKLGVTIVEGTYLSQGTTLKARSFEVPVRTFAGEVGGHAVVILSAEQIGQTLQNLLTWILLITVLFLAIGIGASFFVGERITAPLRALTRDIDTVANGDLNHRTHVRSHDEVGVLAATFDAMTKNLRSAQEAEMKLHAQRHQIRVASEIQESLFPKNLPQIPGYELEGVYHPATDVGADYYDTLSLGGAPAVMVASASGTGTPAAMVMVMARSLITAVAERESTPDQVLRAVNRLLSPDLRRGLYVTVLLARLDPATGKLLLVNAGHSPLIVARAGQGDLEIAHSDGIALGFDRGPVFERTLKPREIEIHPGDRVIFNTPRVFAMKNRKGQELGDQNFYALLAHELAKQAPAPLTRVAQALEKFREGTPAENEITLFGVVRNG